MKFILGLKSGMSQIFDEEGNVIPVTLVEAGPCIITQIKTEEPRSIAKGKLPDKKDSYEAIQIGFQNLKKKKTKKTQKDKPFRHLREFRGDIDISKYKEGDKIDVSIFQEGDMVKVTGLSKGKGFAGVVKRWHFTGRPATHGTKHELRTPGSVGSSFPERVIKGKKMAGRMGHERRTIKNLKIIKVDPEKNLIAVQGAVPGVKGALLEIRG
ncbi:hypothetical protein AMJ48_01730 [Parcubacteria bacterium DG_74_1]|nr:MAG: hypothetical protein AMJ48_01730 [Parcubacteria bacterium DG_74_1]